MSKYRRLEELYRLMVSRGYRTERLKPYRPSKLYPRTYRKPFRAKKASRYTRPNVSRGGRGRLPIPKPNYFQSRPPEKKYELKPKPEKMSSPLRNEVLRYTTGNSVEPWVDAEEIARDVEKRMDSKLTESILERVETELDGLLDRVKAKVENSKEGMAELKEMSETDTLPIESGEETQDEHHEQREYEKLARLENTEDVSAEETTLEGDFILSDSFGLAIPIEVDDAEESKIPEEKDLDENLEQIESVEDAGEIASEAETPTVQEVEIVEGIEPAVEVDETIPVEENFENPAEIENLENAELFDPKLELEPIDEIEPERVEPSQTRT